MGQRTQSGVWLLAHCVTSLTCTHLQITSAMNTSIYGQRRFYRRRAEYFEQILNVADVREANINVVSNWRMMVLADLNERAISLENVGEEVNEMKSGKAPGLDGFPVECLQKGGMTVGMAS